MYIKITNQCQNVNRLKLEKLGFSTKRDDASTIGQFGSGIKFAPISALRKGIPFVFTGSDDKGPYILRYTVKDEDGIPSIYYEYENYEKPSSFTVEAGSLSWETEYQIYREVIANAIDESKLSNTDWTVCLVNDDQINSIPGEFSVFIGATLEMLEIHHNFDRYFSVNRTPIYEDYWQGHKIKLYEPLDDSIRVYCKGMLVYSSANTAAAWSGAPLQGIFDYELDNLKLNEERKVNSEYDMNVSIMRTLANLKDSEHIQRVLDLFVENPDDVETYYELVNIPNYVVVAGSAVWNGFNDSKSNIWNSCFESTHGKSVITSEELATINHCEFIRSKGYSPAVVYTESAYNFLEKTGIPTAKNLFDESFIYKWSKGFASYPQIAQAANILQEIYGEQFETILPSICTFVDEEQESMALGMTTCIQNDETGKKEKLIFLNTDVENSSIQEIIAVIVHEWDHFTSSIGDGNYEGRMFRNLADDRIGELIYRLWLSNKEGN